MGNSIGFNDWLHQQLREQGLTQKDVVKKGNIQKSTLSRLLSGHIRVPGKDVIEGLSKALNIPTKEIMMQAGYPIESDKLSVANYKLMSLSPEKQDQVIDYIDSLSAHLRDHLFTQRRRRVYLATDFRAQ